MKNLTLLLLLSFHISPLNAQETAQIWGDSILCGQKDTAFLYVPFVNGWSNNEIFEISDGDGISTTDSVVVSGFPANATLTNADQIVSICFDIEHSWARDLEIKLTCPNNTQIILHQFAGQTGSQLFFGIPNDDDTFGAILGVPWTYCLSNTPDYNNTFLDYADQTNELTLPSGIYKPFQSLDNLIGCPLNGVWKLSVIDLWPIDNGFVSDFSMYFSSSFDSIAPPQILWSTGDTTQNIAVAQTGSIGVRIITAQGDTLQNFVTISDQTFDYEIIANSSTGNFCDGSLINLQINPSPIIGASYLWFLEGESSILTANDYLSTIIEGNYVTLVTNNGCTIRDTFALASSNSFYATLDTSYIEGSTFTFVDGTPITSMGLYTYSGTTHLGCDSIIVWNVTQLSNSLDLDKSDSFLVFPNPAEDFIFVKTRAAIQPISIKVYDTFGKMWAELPIKSGENLYKINLPNVAGIFKIIIQTEKEVYSKSIFKK
jgi:subtilisin-like proprotein convertase family protein